MKVNAWKNIDVEVEVNVDLSDCINELISIADEKGMAFRKVSAIDGATKVLEKIHPDMIADHVTAEARSLIRKRLQKWIDVTNGATS